MPSRRSCLSDSAKGGAVAAALVVTLSSCATRELARAPARPDQPWRIPEDSEYVGDLRNASHGDPGASAADGRVANAAPPPTKESAGRPDDASSENRVSFDAGHSYALPELIDIAERHHPETREAWERARQAALAVGLAEHTYLPLISAKVIAGYQHTPLPIPASLIPAGFFTFDSLEVLPTLAIDWLLFDFGQRSGQVEAAKAKSFVANVAFTGAHQKVIYSVSRDYFALGAARAHVRVAEYAARNAQLVQDISETRQAHGLATVVEVAQARRQTAQAHFNVVRASGSERSAYSALVASMGVEPTASVGVADSSDRPVPTAPMQDVRTMVEDAVARRPDVIAALGNVRAAEEGLRSARAAYFPKIALSAQVYQNIGALSTEGGPFYSLNKPGASALLGLDLPLFDGGARAAQIAIASSEVSASRAALDGARDRAVEEVTTAYDHLYTSLAEYEAATTVETTATTALDAALDAYRSGVGTLNDVITAENGLSDAQLEKENGRANVFTSAASLAFATGSITSSAPMKR
jgi:outer membrane protein